MIDDRPMCIYVATITPDLQKIGVSRHLQARSLTLCHGAKEFLGYVPDEISFALIGLINPQDARRIETHALTHLPQGRGNREWCICSAAAAVFAVRQAALALGVALVELSEPPASRVMSRPSQSVRLLEPQLEFLWHESERLGITVSELLRRIIDQYREGKESS